MGRRAKQTKRQADIPRRDSEWFPVRTKEPKENTRAQGPEAKQADIPRRDAWYQRCNSINSDVFMKMIDAIFL